jgi:hypothetical protein
LFILNGHERASFQLRFGHARLVPALPGRGATSFQASAADHASKAELRAASHVGETLSGGMRWPATSRTKGKQMTYHNDTNDGRPRTPKSESIGWGIPIGIAAVIFVAATIIFTAAGPDRTRTAEYNTPNSNRAPQATSQPAESGIPPSNQDAPQSAPAPTVAPQKSNPAGTQ